MDTGAQSSVVDRLLDFVGESIDVGNRRIKVGNGMMSRNILWSKQKCRLQYNPRNVI